MGIFLIGTAGSRRTEYFLKAAAGCQAAVTFVDWSEVADADLSGGVVKIDPPSYCTSNLFDMNGQVGAYRSGLKQLEYCGSDFLNTPAGIGSVLDKYKCKKTLMDNGIPSTEMIAGNIYTTGQLAEAMERRRTYSVFIKPVVCSGAAGVCAYRKIPGSAKEVVHTSCCVRDGELVNTKRMYRLEDRGKIRELLQSVLSLGVVVERWHPKASFRGKSYDLRVVWQFGRIEFMVARQSGGPITNLHLNNSPLDWRALALPERTLADIDCLCREAMKLFPGLRAAGIDVLLEQGTLRPRIIEINGQGDLIYQDIFNENNIYRRQIEELEKRWI